MYTKLHIAKSCWLAMGGTPCGGLPCVSTCQVTKRCSLGCRREQRGRQLLQIHSSLYLLLAPPSVYRAEKNISSSPACLLPLFCPSLSPSSTAAVAWKGATRMHVIQFLQVRGGCEVQLHYIVCLDKEVCLCVSDVCMVGILYSLLANDEPKVRLTSVAPPTAGR